MGATIYVIRQEDIIAQDNGSYYNTTYVGYARSKKKAEKIKAYLVSKSSQYRKSGKTYPAFYIIPLKEII